MNSSDKVFDFEAFEAALDESSDRGPSAVAPEPGSASDSWRQSLREAAAVLGPTAPDALCSLVEAQGVDEDDRASAATDFVSSPNGDWLLDLQVRRETLARLVEDQRLDQALENTHAAEADPYRAALIAMQQPSRLRLEKLPLDDLRRLRQVRVWLGRASTKGPSLEDINAAIEARELVEPFHRLGGRQFKGRRDDLAALRDFAEVFDSSTVYEQASRAIASNFQGGRRAPLNIWGPGGIGKSALLSRFILDHAEIIDASARIPYAYLDCDSPDLDLLRPETILVAIAHQLVRQRPDPELLKRIESSHRRLQSQSRRGTGSSNPFGSKRYESMLEGIGRWLNEYDKHEWAPDPAPFLLVVDTFEEVQLAGETRERLADRFLRGLQRAYPRIRIVICGRAKVRSFKVTSHRLNGLDAESAMDLLAHHGVEEAELRNMIVHRVGTSPLSLTLAARAVASAEDGDQQELFDDIRSRRGFFMQRVDAGEIQGQLYDRILKHIRDPEVRKLAHPGLVLRRITPDVIREVLADPCGLDPDDAQSLFDRLTDDVALVELGPDGALYHRPDVRRIMLRSILSSPSHADTVAQIHQNAIEYYESSQEPIATAEEIYHRLMVGDTEVLLRDVNADIRRALEPSFEDPMPPRSHAWLASLLGIESGIDWRQADVDDWEHRVRRRANEAMQVGDLESALGMLREREERTPGSPLYALEAELLQAMQDPRGALDVVDRGIESMLETGHRAELSRLYPLGAAYAQIVSDDDLLERYLRDGRQLAEDERDYLGKLRLGLLEFEVADAEDHGDSAPEDGDDATADAESDRDVACIRLIQAFTETPDDVLVNDPDLALAVLRRLGDRLSVAAKAVRALRPIEGGPDGEALLMDALQITADSGPDGEQVLRSVNRSLGISEDEAPLQMVASQTIRHGQLPEVLLTLSVVPAPDAGLAPKLAGIVLGELGADAGTETA